MVLLTHLKLINLCSSKNLNNSIFKLLINKSQSDLIKNKNYSNLSSKHQTNIQSKDIVNPFQVVENDLQNLYANIKKELWTDRPELREISNYYFDAQGKAFRPMIIVLIGRALNYHYKHDSSLNESQKIVSMVTEMIHTASLVHDDVIDMADKRRGKPSVNVIWGPKKAILAGDFILSRASQLIAKLRNEETCKLISQSLIDLVQGEFLQMGSKEKETDRFNHYIDKTFKKTASLIAYTCKSVALLSNNDENLQKAAFEYGKSLGIAFQLVDDLLDFISSESDLGKPAGADLKLGLATAPVLFASEYNSDLKKLIERRFSLEGDVEKAFKAVHDSDGLEKTRSLARKHINEALKSIEPFKDCVEKQALIQIAEITLSRNK